MKNILVTLVRRLALLATFLFSLALSGRAQNGAALPAGGTPVVAPGALLTTPVSGLERTQASAQIVAVTGQPFAQALRVVVQKSAPETNATQLTLPTSAPVEKGDTLLASFYVRGAAAATTGGSGPAQAEFLFERSTDPWTKSASQRAPAGKNTQWRRILVPFTAAEAYRPGEAMVSLRFAFGPQTIEVGGLSVTNYAKTRTEGELVALVAQNTPLGNVAVSVRRGDVRQTLRGFGGNFAQPRYGATEPLDATGRYNLANLRVVHARIGIPLNAWTPQRGVYKEDGPARAALQQMQEMARKGIPITGSVWEGPQWMLPGPAEQGGRTLPRERYADCIEAIAQFLVTARDKYNARVEHFSFNEPDYGINFKFSPTEMADFIRQAGPRFRALGLTTKFLVGDTANGANFPGYVRPLLADKTIAPYLGPLAFHSWDVLGAPEARYQEIAVLGRQHNKPVWCTEAGHDAQLWQKPNPWESWENALRTALAYEKTLRLSGTAQIDYWTYQDNYPLAPNKAGAPPYPAWFVVRQMEQALAPGAKIAGATSDNEDLRALAAAGPQSGQFSVLLVNPAGAGRVTVSGLPAGARVFVTRSTAARQNEALAPVRADNAGRLTVSVPPRSVVTLVSTR